MTVPTAPDVVLAQQAAILAIDECAIPVVSRDRSLPRKELAALVRKLFRELGIRGASVTAPNYSMASAIDIHLPKRQDFVLLDPTADRYAVDPTCAARVDNGRVVDKVREILARAFPQHDDRSDSQSDHFDFKFSIQ